MKGKKMSLLGPRHKLAQILNSSLTFKVLSKYWMFLNIVMTFI